MGISIKMQGRKKIKRRSNNPISEFIFVFCILHILKEKNIKIYDVNYR